MTRIDEHKAITNELTEIYAAKNRDYGNSFGDQYKEHGIISSVIRLDDKMRRLKQITKNGTKVKSETVEDTLKDMANYAIMTLIEVQNDGNHDEEEITTSKGISLNYYANSVFKK